MSILLIVVILLVLGGGIWGWPLVAGIFGLSNVTDKASAIKHINQMMNRYDISPTEIETAFINSSKTHLSSEQRSKGDIAKTLFAYLGSIFILAGIGTYIGLFWQSMGSIMRVVVTLGVGYVLLIIFIAALYENKYPKAILPLSLASVFMMTGGWLVLIHEIFPHGDNWRAAMLFVFAIMALHQTSLFAKYQLTILLFTTLFFIYGFLNVGLDMLGVHIAYIAIVLGASVYLVGTALEKSSHRVLVEPALFIGVIWLYSGVFDRIAMLVSTNWASVITGLCLAITAYGLHKANSYNRLVSLGYFIGSIIAYAGLFDLIQHSAFELLYLAITASILYACVVVESRALLVTTVIAMLSFIAYFSEKYFADSLGWPATLVLMGIAFLAVGTLAIKVKQRI